MSHRYNERKRRHRALDAFLYEPRCSKTISFKGVAGIDQYALARREPLASVRRTYANLEVQALGIRDSANWADTERLFRLGKCLSLGDSMVNGASHSRSAEDRFPRLLQELPGSVILQQVANGTYACEDAPTFRAPRTDGHGVMERTFDLGADFTSPPFESVLAAGALIGRFVPHPLRILGVGLGHGLVPAMLSKESRVECVENLPLPYSHDRTPHVPKWDALVVNLPSLEQDAAARLMSPLDGAPGHYCVIETVRHAQPGQVSQVMTDYFAVLDREYLPSGAPVVVLASFELQGHVMRHVAQTGRLVPLQSSAMGAQLPIWFDYRHPPKKKAHLPRRTGRYLSLWRMP